MSILIIEDGSQVADANAYVSLDDCAAYCIARGLTFATSPSGDGETAIVRATAFVDGTYRARFPGYRTGLRAQGLEWPRSYAYDAESNLIPSNEVPVEIINAICEAAAREFAEPGSLAPDLERGGSIQQLQAGSVSITYGSNASADTSFQAIDGILSGLIGSSNGFTAHAVRG